MATLYKDGITIVLENPADIRHYTKLGYEIVSDKAAREVEKAAQEATQKAEQETKREAAKDAGIPDRPDVAENPVVPPPAKEKVSPHRKQKDEGGLG